MYLKTGKCRFGFQLGYLFYQMVHEQSIFKYDLAVLGRVFLRKPVSDLKPGLFFFPVDQEHSTALQSKGLQNLFQGHHEDVFQIPCQIQGQGNIVQYGKLQVPLLDHIFCKLSARDILDDAFVFNFFSLRVLVTPARYQNMNGRTVLLLEIDLKIFGISFLVDFLEKSTPVFGI